MFMREGGLQGHYTNAFGSLDDMLAARDHLVEKARAAGVSGLVPFNDSQSPRLTSADGRPLRNIWIGTIVGTALGKPATSLPRSLR
jgi:hypothetical protein